MSNRRNYEESCDSDSEVCDSDEENEPSVHPDCSNQVISCDYSEDPNCFSKIRNDLKSICINTANYGTYVSNLVGRLPKTLEILSLGHDGVIKCSDVEGDDIKIFEKLIISLPKLKKIYHCGYYCDYTSSDIKTAAKNCDRIVRVIKIY